MSFTIIRNVIGVGLALLIAWYSHGEVKRFDKAFDRDPKQASNPWAKTP